MSAWAGAIATFPEPPSERRLFFLPQNRQHITSIINICYCWVIYLCFFCCEDDNQYSNSSTSSPLPTTTILLLYQSSPPDSHSRGEVTTTKTINYRNGTHHASLTSHYVKVTGRIPSLSRSARPQRPISPTTFIAPAVSPHHPPKFSL